MAEQTPASNPIPLPLTAPNPRRLPLLLRRAWYGLNQAFRRRMAHLEMTPDQFTALRTLLEGDRRGLTQSQLTQAMSSDPNTVASLLDRLEQAGWIERRSHEHDRRARRSRVLPAGKRKFAAAREIALQLQADILAVLPPEESERFLEQLAQVADACRQAADEVTRTAQRKAEP